MNVLARKLSAGWLIFCVLGIGVFPLSSTWAQEAPPAGENSAADAEASGADLAQQRFDEAMSSETVEEEEAAAEELPTGEIPEINVLELLYNGGIWSVPIILISLGVVAIGIERGIALRRSKVMPMELIDALSAMSQQGSFDPRKAYRLCQQYPSASATVIRAMLLKVGRPHSEVEHAVAEASNREAARLYSNVRFLNLASALAPLLGLLGTVVGMLQAFFIMANMPVGVNKGAEFAGGIYIALVTTVEGLCVAIPAAFLAHLFEGRIMGLLREVDELLFNLLPQVERFENKLRVRREQLTGESRPGGENGDSRSVEADVVPTPPPVATPATAARSAAAK